MGWDTVITSLGAATPIGAVIALLVYLVKRYEARNAALMDRLVKVLEDNKDAEIERANRTYEINKGFLDTLNTLNATMARQTATLELIQRNQERLSCLKDQHAS